MNPDHFLDTCILLRLSDSGSVLHLTATKAVARLIANGTPLHITAQNIIEFWATATRPQDANGLGWDTIQTSAVCQGFLTRFNLLSDTDAIFTEWLRLVTDNSLKGRRVFDARLAAVMKVHSVSALLTFDEDHFNCFQHISVVRPESVA